MPGGRYLWKHRQKLILPAAALLLALLVLLVRSFVAEPHLVVSDSMWPTLTVRDRLVVEKVSYQLHPPRPRDIVVFKPPAHLQQQGPRHPDVFIKRVIALPGHVVQVRAGQVLVDGQPLQEPYVAEPPNYEWGPTRVPEGMLFVLGDNRNASSDSHDWGFLPQLNVTGRVWLRFWPPGRAGGV